MIDTPEAVSVWQYERLYDRISREGHLYPAPACGSPAIIWHVGIAPHRRFGDNPFADDVDLLSPELKPDWVHSELRDMRKLYNRHFKAFVEEFNAIAQRLQTAGRVTAPEVFEIGELLSDREPGLRKPTSRFLTATPQTLSFPIWWPDDRQLQASREHPSEEDLRVQVQLQMHTGYATATFIIDVSKPYGAAQIESVPPEVFNLANLGNVSSIQKDSIRRNKVRRALNIIRSSMARQIRLGVVDKPRLPEEDVLKNEAEDLLETANYLYQEIWDEFCEDFGLNLLASAKAEGEKGSAASANGPTMSGRRFVDLRGHVMSVAGLQTKRSEDLQSTRQDLLEKNLARQAPPMPETATDRLEDQETALGTWRKGFGIDLSRTGDLPPQRAGASGFGLFPRFSGDSGSNNDAENESNTVLRALWPFTRRMSPFADTREIVGCGIMDWRGLFLSTLGFPGQTDRPLDGGPSREKEVPMGHLPPLEYELRIRGYRQETRDPVMDTYRSMSRPMRFLIVTKGEPHREQLGRFVERMNNLETLRSFALRQITSIRNAGVHLELIGRQLDGLMESWAEQRRKIQKEYLTRMDETTSTAKRRKRWFGWLIGLMKRESTVPEDADTWLPPTGEQMALEEERTRKLNQLTDRVDSAVIGLTAELDRIGQGGAGRMIYAIRRSELAISEFERLVPTVRIGDIDGWVSYKQFINRGVRPSFEFVKLTGRRLVATRERLQSITETIQTAALIAATQSVQANTHTLRRIATYFYLLRWTMIILFSIIAVSVIWVFGVPLIGQPPKTLKELLELIWNVF